MYPGMSNVYKAIISLSYYACLRAGEAAVSNSNTHTLHIDNVSIDSNNSINLKFRSLQTL